ncbi:calmodulin-like protein 3 [Impatiens glandulifera]|uniref:calmodulin-like protein 3 n=1 Tax=Impatiens glandulifera TaxID=253017 RepID=UPI001FB11B66|nr:calmodulin-like protein 3 [Impatiens glandulifera]
MATLFLNLVSLYNILKTILFHLIPSKYKLYFPCSWYSKLQTTTSIQLSPPQNTQQPDSHGLRRSFLMFDHDGDGLITKDELKESLENLGIFISASDLKRVIEDVDSDGDGCIGFTEFTELYGSIVGDYHDGGEETDLVREAFDVFDLNGDGFISVDELWSVMGSLGIKQGRAAEDCRTMISKVDGDGDGRVSFYEFKQMLKVGGFSALN